MLLLQCVASHPDTKMPFLKGNAKFLIHLNYSEFLSAVIFTSFNLIVIELDLMLKILVFSYGDTDSLFGFG